ncbi:MAG: sulfatase-like hydrolase/transferase [Planctomycetes bacterium]|nr:sulfatase-like hydrolase/transferase [Planctomycetota bacterium]
MKRRDFLKAAGAVTALGLGGMAKAAGLGDGETRKKPRGRPNFVFFLVDDLGRQDLGCYGSTFYETPNLDRLAAQGMRFTSAYAACPVCSPTRASIMTGKYPARIRLTNYIAGARPGKLLSAEYFHYMKLEEVTLAEALKEAGYRTNFVGKWHLGNEPYYPEKQGFDVNVGGCDAGAPPTYFYPYTRGNRSIPGLEQGQPGEYLTDRLADESRKLIEQSKDQPFLLYLSFYAVHIPLQAKKELVEKYTAKAKQLGLEDKPHFATDEQWPKTAAGDAKWRATLRTRILQDHAVYSAMMESLDQAVGRVLNKLDELGLADNTIVFFMSDNGGLATAEGQPTCNLPLRAGKGWLYEGGIREPMIIKWPGMVKPGSTCDEPVTSTDFYPTMLEMAGLPLKPGQHVDGQSMVPLLKGTGGLQRKAIYWHYPHYSNQGGGPGGAVRMGDFKLIESYEDNRVELYNLRADLGEQHDLAAEMPEKAAELRRMLQQWRRVVDAVMPEPNPKWKNGKMME